VKIPIALRRLLPAPHRLRWLRARIAKDRHPSGLAQVLEAHEARRTRPTPGAIAEHHLRAVAHGGRIALPWWWPGTDRRVHSPREAVALHESAGGDELYRDVHVWCFTPESFARLLEELRHLDLLRCRIVEGPRASGYEFFAVLSAG